MGKYYITTPIYYINDKPHIGHAYCTIAADVQARYHREQGDEVMFTTGLDENSQKTTIAAEMAGQAVNVYTDSMANRWKSTWDMLGISSDQFIRTTSKGHHQTVTAFLKQVQATGDLYMGEYEGFYCVGHEAFMREDELVNGLCPDHNKAPELVKEANYFFRLSKYQDKLLAHIEGHPEFIQPESRRNEVVAFIKRGLQDFSVSRNKKTWGIAWPGNPDQVVYVWFDALLNYLTATGYPEATYQNWWPADLHLVGKDITKFHCVYWPAMLMSAGVELPKAIFGHGFFTVNGQKISKSLNNAIDPQEIVQQFGVDALRYFLMREIPFGADGEFTQERFESVYNTDLANELGNLVQRTAVMVQRYFSGTLGEIPPATHDSARFHEHMAALKFDRALEDIWELVKGANAYIEEEKPWALAKTDTEQLAVVLRQVVSDLLQIAKLLMPFMPASAARISATFADGKIDESIGLLFPKADSLEETIFEVK